MQHIWPEVIWRPNAGTSQGNTPPDFWAGLGKSVHDVFSNDATPTVIAFLALALALSLVALVNQFSRGRKADLSVRFAKSPDYKYKADLLVVTNHGAASAKGVKLDLIVDLEARPAHPHGFPEVKGGKQPWKPYRGEPFPIPRIAPGLTIYVAVNLYGNRSAEVEFADAVLTWKDKRVLRQSWKSTINTIGETLGTPSLANFHAEQQARLRSLSV